MSIFNLFSKRQKRLRGEIPDVFRYDDIPGSLRVQIVHIWRDALGDPGRYGSRAPGMYKVVHDALAREYGRFSLGNPDSENEVHGLINFLLQEKSAERVLDAIETSFRLIESVTDDYSYRHSTAPSVSAQEAIDELNVRFLEHGVGFEYASGELIRKDSEYLHSDVVKPALAVLSGSHYSGANEEFRSAHEHYRHGRHKECLNDCLKALESTLKAICTSKGWKFKPTDTAKTLLDICFQHGLIPAYLQSEFTSLRSTLESGVPTVRNKTSGHGQGVVPIVVPQHLASYMLHLTATSILFLAKSAET